MNIWYDTYRKTKQVLKAVRQNHREKLSSNLTSQGFITTFTLNHSLKAVNSLWYSTQTKLRKNSFNFTVRYLNNTFATRQNLKVRNLSKASDCPFCLHPESFLHVVAGCKTYLNEGCFTWKHDSALNFFASSLQCLNHCTFYIFPLLL